jgi:hypothetical protein
VPTKEGVRSVPTKEEIREYFAKFGRKGGKLAAKKMTPEERSESARRASLARWAKAKKAPKP